MEKVDEKHGSSSSSPSPELQQLPQQEEHSQCDTVQPSKWRRIYDILTWTPPNCRYDPKNPPGFSMGLNILFAFAGAFTVVIILAPLASNFEWLKDL